MTIKKAAWAVLGWCAKALAWVLTAEDRMLEAQIDKLRKQPGFERAAEEAARLDAIRGGRRNMHRVLDRYGVPDARWFK